VLASIATLREDVQMDETKILLGHGNGDELSTARFASSFGRPSTMKEDREAVGAS
jgi:hypothetical protein